MLERAKNFYPAIINVLKDLKEKINILGKQMGKFTKGVEIIFKNLEVLELKYIASET